MEIDFWDETEPESIINLVPASVRNYMRAIPSDWRSMSEEEATKRCEKLHEGSIPNDLARIRIQFWYEHHNRHWKRGRGAINMSNIYGPICSLGRFERIIANSFNLAYILTPIGDLEECMEQMLYYATQSMDEVLSMPLKNKKGEINYSLIDKKMKIWEKLHDRKYGSAIQRSEVKSLNVNANVDKPLPKLEDLTAEIQRLEAKQKALSAPTSQPSIKDKLSIASEMDVEVEAIRVDDRKE